MSVINNVLKELEQRPTSFKPLELDDSIDQQKNSRGSWFVALLLALIILLATGVIYLLFVDRQHDLDVSLDSGTSSNDPPEINAQITTDEPLPKPLITERAAVNKITTNPELTSSGIVLPENSEKPTNRITGLHIRENEQYMELEFQMLEQASSFLKQRSNNRYVFVIKQIADSIEAPLISGSPWLKAVQIKPLQESVEIRFDTLPGVLVETRDESREGAYFWFIRLKKVFHGKIEAKKAVSTATAKVLPEKTHSKKSRPEKNRSSSGKQTGERNTRPDSARVASTDSEKPQPRVDIQPVEAPSEELRFEAIRQSIASGQLHSAKADLKEFLGGKLDHPARLQLVQIYSRIGESVELDRLLQQSIKLYPADDFFQLQHANRLFASGRYAALISVYSKANLSQSLRVLLASSYQRLGQHALAEQHYLTLLQSNPRQPKLWISLAISQQQLDKSQQALKSYKLALSSGPLSQKLRNYAEQQIRQLSTN